MKRFIFLLTICLSVTLLNAQVKNKDGEKVVRQIEGYLPGYPNNPFVIINFNYSDDLQLEEIHLNAPASYKIVWKRDGGKLTRVQYDNDKGLRNDLIYHYDVNTDNNLITKCIIDNVGIDGSILRFDYKYDYDGFNNILTINKRVFHRERNGKFTETSDRYREMFEWDLMHNVYTTGECGYKWKENQPFDFSILYDRIKYYPQLVNDTNIDLPMLNHYLCNCIRFELVTEWRGNHPKYLLERYYGCYFDYTFDNEYGGLDLDEERGNLIRIDVYNKYNNLKRLEKTYKIYYWE